MMMPRLWNVTVRFVDQTKEPFERVVLAETPSRALDALTAGLLVDEIDVMTVRENSTSIDRVAWEPSK